MIANLNQRWRERKAIYRRPDEQIQVSRYEVASIPDDTTPKSFIIEHHYSGTYPAARFRFGLYCGGQLVGVAVYSHPMNDKVLHIFPGELLSSVELGRLVLLDSVPGNGESFFVARTFELLEAEGMIGVVSHSDPMPRVTTEGEVVFKGHIGICYQATNGAYLGRSTSKYQKLLPDGVILSERAISKMRAKAAGKPVNVCQGWNYGVTMLRSYGACEPDPENLGPWLKEVMKKYTRSQYHPGNYRYAWILQRKLRKHMPPRLKYPKVTVRV